MVELKNGTRDDSIHGAGLGEAWAVIDQTGIGPKVTDHPPSTLNTRSKPPNVALHSSKIEPDRKRIEGETAAGQINEYRTIRM